MTVQAILKRKGTKVHTTTPATAIKAAAGVMRENNIAALLVIDDGALRGIVTERDIVRAFATLGEGLGQRPVSEIMTVKLITGKPGDSVKHVMQIMTRHRIRHFPVLDGDKVAGMVSIGDVVRHRLEDLELEANVLRDAYIAAR
jgi:CBS domain-containing protein